MKIKIKKNKPMSVIIKTAQVKPELEDLEVTPAGVEQNFKSNKYGYDNVKVKAVESEELTITPNTEEQVKEGMFNKVTVTGDEDLKAENIKQGVNIFGVEGIAKVSNVKITDASRLFYQNSRIDNLNELLGLCENVTSTEYMFAQCTSLTNLDLSNFDTSNSTNMREMFTGCSEITELDLSNFNTNKVTNFRYMFNGCRKLIKVNLSNFDTSNVTNVNGMFYSCSMLTELDLSNFNTSKVTDIGSMFNSCTKLTKLNLGSFDMSKATNCANMLSNCINLTSLISFKDLGKAYTQKTTNHSNYKLDLSACTQLTHESLMDVINNLYDLNLTYNVANGGTLYRQQLKLGSTNLAKLTATEEGQLALAEADRKGWNVT